MSLEQFAAEPRDHQVAYASWYWQSLPSFVEVWLDQRKTPNDLFTASPSRDDSPKAALASGIWLMRLALAHDPDIAEKLVIAAHEGLAPDAEDGWLRLAELSPWVPRGMAEGQIVQIPDVGAGVEFLDYGDGPELSFFHMPHLEFPYPNGAIGSGGANVFFQNTCTDFQGRPIVFWSLDGGTENGR